ncbi:glycosyltransferase family protein [Vibrio fluvialis]|uniref:glycosyltransferase n=1 Tax=Vibrio fluvialis TaxID=676 RepID=UPI001F33319E|nr:glycosyltransferase [Vibrio fluvialis]MCE7597873.1 hypothetical protein [Vibrio fluvialis]UPO64960.1 glycosyl transferase [Vibrio fluvialis]
MKKALVVSADGISEKTGGGIYLRGVLDGISTQYFQTIIICKKNKSNIEEVLPSRYGNLRLYQLNRTLFSDVMSRFFFQMSFLSFYLRTILTIIKDENPDVIYIHGTKHGALIKIIKLLHNDIPIVLLTDNVEQVLYEKLYKLSKFKIRSYFELMMIKYSEKLSLKYSSVISYITQTDQNISKSLYEVRCKTFLWPVTIFNDIEQVGDGCVNKQSYGLFTGSFRFLPNIEACKEIVSIFKNKSTEIKIAGLDAMKLNDFTKDYENIELISNPNDFEMRKIFEEALFFISMVKSGSGMKTKVAEALKYGLPVLGTEHSFIGYEDIFGEDVIMLMKDDTSLDKFLSYIYSADYSALRKKCHSLYKEFYSEQTSIKCAQRSISIIRQSLEAR